jgi:hypothetical protein
MPEDRLSIFHIKRDATSVLTGGKVASDFVHGHRHFAGLPFALSAIAHVIDAYLHVIRYGDILVRVIPFWPRRLPLLPESRRAPPAHRRVHHAVQYRVLIERLETNRLAPRLDDSKITSKKLENGICLNQVSSFARMSIVG